jgi:hypothetical protein
MGVGVGWGSAPLVKPAFEPGTHRLNLKGTGLARQPKPALEADYCALAQQVRELLLQSLTPKSARKLQGQRFDRYMAVIVVLVIVVLVIVMVPFGIMRAIIARAAFQA